MCLIVRFNNNRNADPPSSSPCSSATTAMQIPFPMRLEVSSRSDLAKHVRIATIRSRSINSLIPTRKYQSVGCHWFSHIFPSTYHKISHAYITSYHIISGVHEEISWHFMTRNGVASLSLRRWRLAMPVVQCCSSALPMPWPWAMAEPMAEAKQAACSQGRPQNQGMEKPSTNTMVHTHHKKKTTTMKD